MKIVIKTLGCKANRYESDKLIEQLRKKGHDIAVSGSGADILIVNTCTVTHRADRKSRQAIRSFKNVNLDCKVVVFGCGARISHDEYEKMDEVDEVFGEVEELVESICNVQCTMRDEVIFGLDTDVNYRTRAVIKIQDGCNNYCSYCIIPHARGPEVSFNSRRILREVQKKEAEGFKEIVLTGIVMSSWKEGNMDFADLIELLLDKTCDVRFRLSSIEPRKYPKKFFDLFKCERICPHIHMALQSGSDGVLKRMRRRYDTALFRGLCEKFRQVCPDVGLTTDVIVGFPGETDAEFRETCDFVRRIGFLKIHVFPYSRRKNTAAYHMPGQISSDVKKERAGILRNISNEMSREFKRLRQGVEYDVLVESCENGVCRGFTPNYIPVEFSCDKDLYNKRCKVEPASLLQNGVFKASLLHSQVFSNFVSFALIRFFFVC